MNVKESRYRCSHILMGIAMVVLAGMVFSNPVHAAKDKPNILVIFGDDVGISNISAYSDGLMGYETPNIDRIAKEGIRFLHYYGEQSCTAGRAAFLTGQHGIRTGLTKVGFPGAPMGMSQLDPSIGGLLKNLGYATGQFGKNHVGDRNETLPTVNGFDEFFGNLYHLNAEEEPELPDYPKDPAYRAKFGPRGVLKCKATDKDDPTVDPRFGKIGKQTIEDTGALTKKRMETIDDETSAAAIDFMKRQHAAGKPFFCWFNATRMHLRTHVRPEHRGRYKHGDSEYIDGMIEHDDTDRHAAQGPGRHGHRQQHDRRLHQRQRPAHEHLARRRDDALSLREEHQLGGRVPRALPGPLAGRDQARHGDQRTHEPQRLGSHALLPSPASRTSSANCMKGYTANGKNYKVHLDGYDQSKFLRNVERHCGEQQRREERARQVLLHRRRRHARGHAARATTSTSSRSSALPGTMRVWAEPFTKLRLQKIYNLFQDPYERADITSNTFWDWQLNHVGSVYGVMDEVFKFAATFKEFPPRSIPPSFNPATIMDETIDDIRDAQKRAGQTNK